MFLRGSLAVELLYDLPANSTANAQLLLKLFIRHELNLETGSIHILCFLTSVMLLRGAFTVELSYGLMTNGAADSLALLKLFIRHEPNLKTGSNHIFCSLSEHHVS